MYKYKINIGTDLDQISKSILVRTFSQDGCKLEEPYFYFNMEDLDYRKENILAELDFFGLYEENI